MERDPLVEESRAAGRALEEGAPGDVHAFFERLRRAQELYRDRVVSESGVREAGEQAGRQDPARPR